MSTGFFSRLSQGLWVGSIFVSEGWEPLGMLCGCRVRVCLYVYMFMYVWCVYVFVRVRVYVFVHVYVCGVCACMRVYPRAFV